MKKRELLILITPLVLITILLISFVPKSNNDTLLFISDYLWYNYNFEKIDTINTSYIYPSLTSKELLRYIEDDTLKIGESSSLRKEIKNATIIYLSIGMEDLINNININYREKKLSYDKDILSLHADILVNQYQHIIEEILLLNKDIKIITSSLYYPYPYINDNELMSFYTNINYSIKEINKNGIYLDISSYAQEIYLDSINDYKLNTIALNKIYNEIINLNSLYH